MNRRAVAKIMCLEDIKSKLADLGADSIGSTPEELAAFLRTEMTKWAGGREGR
jgi:hypothetical protein